MKEGNMIWQLRIKIKDCSKLLNVSSGPQTDPEYKSVHGLAMVHNLNKELRCKLMQKVPKNLDMWQQSPFFVRIGL